MSDSVEVVYVSIDEVDTDVSLVVLRVVSLVVLRVVLLVVDNVVSVVSVEDEYVALEVLTLVSLVSVVSVDDEYVALDVLTLVSLVSVVSVDDEYVALDVLTLVELAELDDFLTTVDVDALLGLVRLTSLVLDCEVLIATVELSVDDE